MPTYFPAISGTGTNALPQDLVSLVATSSYPRILVSAFDLTALQVDHQRKAIHDLVQFRKSGGVVLLDSGAFESFWLRGDKWTFKTYSEAVRRFPSDFYCSFDQYHVRGRPRKPVGMRLVQVADSSAKIRPDATCLFIARGPTPSRLVTAVKSLIDRRSVPVEAIAVPERECGPNLLARSKTVAQVRSVLSERSEGIILHLLGCGHPKSLAIYAYCGADSFDSQDWSQLAVDRNTLEFVDIAHLELVHCKCGVCSRIKVDNYQRTLLHNLLFYQDFAIQLQRMIRENTMRDFLMARLGEPFLKKLETAVSISAPSSLVSTNVGN